MTARPTDRAPASKLGKITARMSQTVNESTILQPVSNSVSYLAKQAIFRALKHIQFGSITIIEDFTGQPSKTHILAVNLLTRRIAQLLVVIH